MTKRIADFLIETLVIGTSILLLMIIFGEIFTSGATRFGLLQYSNPWKELKLTIVFFGILKESAENLPQKK